MNVDKNGKDTLVDNLKTLGLSEREALVYLALLRVGETGTSPIIRDTNLHGQYVYQALGTLEERGLVQHAIRRGRKKFTAKNPRTLTRLIEHQRVIAQDLAVKLEELMVLPPEQRFEVFQGKEAYVAHEFEILERQPEDSELLVIGGAGDKFNENMGSRIQEYATLQARKNITIRYIGSESQRASMQEMHGRRKLFEVRYLPGLFTGQVNTNIWPDLLCFNIFGEPVTRFTIWNPVVAGSYKQFFETLWRLAKE